MIRFKQYLQEESIKFKNAKDSDAFTNSKLVILHDEDDIYIISGQTHGLSSHAIKHLIEFDPNYVNQLVEKIIAILNKDANKYYLKKFNSKEVKKEDVKLTRNIIINTLDRINDKIENNKKLTGWEITLKNYIKHLTDRFNSIIVKNIKNSLDITKYNEKEIRKAINDLKIVSFWGDHPKLNLKQRIYFDFKTKGMIIEQDGKVRTFFKIARIKDIFKHIENINPKIFKEIINERNN